MPIKSTFSFITSLCALLFFVNVSNAQQRKILSGAIFDKEGNQPVRMANVTNISIGKTAVSRVNGTFEIEATAGNIISFGANGFYADTVSITTGMYETGNILLTLRPLPNTLTDVTVVGNLSAYQIDSIARRKSFLEDVGDNEIPVVSRANDLGFGVGINIDRFSKREKRKRKARDIFTMMEEEAYVNYRWNEALLQKYTTYRDDELIAFMERNRPEYLWLRKNTTEKDLMYYINTSLKKEKKHKP